MNQDERTKLSNDLHLILSSALAPYQNAELKSQLIIDMVIREVEGVVSHKQADEELKAYQDHVHFNKDHQYE